MAEVTLYPGESIEQAMRRFKRQVLREGIIREAKRRTFFLKPCEAKKLKSKLARSRSRKTMSFR
ncbi:MAG: 30S ribosomal protein S21 [Blastocatellia bacterium]